MTLTSLYGGVSLNLVHLELDSHPSSRCLCACPLPRPTLIMLCTLNLRNLHAMARLATSELAGHRVREAVQCMTRRSRACATLLRGPELLAIGRCLAISLLEERVCSGLQAQGKKKEDQQARGKGEWDEQGDSKR